MRTIRLAAFAATALLGACGQLADQYETLAAEHQPTIIIPAGMKVRAGDREFAIWGDDVCPDNDRIMALLFGHAPGAGRRECIAVPKDAQSVTVHFANRIDGVRTEQWRVVRLDDKHHFPRFSFARPDGTLVGPLL